MALNGPTLSAKDIGEVLQERILRGTYPLGSALPSVRQLGAELGASPSTVSRALQQLEREGWVQVANRRGAVVARKLPRGEDAEADIEAALHRLAMRWRLSGRPRDGFEQIAERVNDDVFRPEPVAYFLECNPIDLTRMAEELRHETADHRIVPLLIDEVRAEPTKVQAGGVVLVPFFHLADVRGSLPSEVDLVPLNFVPSEEFMRAIADLNASTLVGVIARDERSRRRIEGIVHQYSLAHTDSTVVDDAEGVERILRTAEVVVTANSAGLPRDVLARAKRSMVLQFELEKGELDLSSLLLRQGGG